MRSRKTQGRPWKWRLLNNQLGATLIEMGYAVGIAAILSAVAVPGFKQLHRNAVRTTIVNDVVHSIFLARSEAIKRNRVVSICRSIDGAHCANTAANWNSGWIVFVNLDADQPADTDPGEEIIHRHMPITSGKLDSNRDSFSFRPISQGDVNGTITFCPEPNAKDGRAIIISHTGRPRTSDKDASGKAVKC